jgi:N-hydroxyarylamine O-acetyltransferase
MSTPGFDLDAYLARIGYAGPRTSTLETLHGISLHHTTTIPFENLDVLLGRPVALTPEALMAKLVHAKRGGYCFEQNNLLLLALRALGFQASLLGARVRGPIPREEIPYRTHTFVKVSLPGGEFLADAGLGSASLTGAIPLVFDRELPTPHETRRLTRDGVRLFHEIRQGDTWMDVCEFSLEEFHFVDCEVGNWWTSAHPRSHFRGNLIVGRALRDGTRKVIREGKFIHRRGAEILSSSPLTSAEQLLVILRADFGLEFPAGTRFGPPGAPWA